MIKIDLHLLLYSFLLHLLSLSPLSLYIAAIYQRNKVEMLTSMSLRSIRDYRPRSPSGRIASIDHTRHSLVNRVNAGHTRTIVCRPQYIASTSFLFFFFVCFSFVFFLLLIYTAAAAAVYRVVALHDTIQQEANRAPHPKNERKKGIYVICI